MPATYAEREITITIQLGQGSFGDAGSDKVTLRGLRCACVIESAIQTPATAIVRVYGLTLSRINQLTKAGTLWTASNNTILVEAGDLGGPLKAVFEGDIFEAKPEFNNQPDVSFLISATSGRIARMKPVPPNTFKGSVSVETVIKKIIEPAGWALENSGVTEQLSSPYFPGSTWTQLRAACEAARCFFFLDQQKKTVAIWPRDGSRSGDAPLVSPETGMIGYPEFQAAAVSVRTLFNPEIMIGKAIQVSSQLSAANGRWSVFGAAHNLAAQLPDGPWETTATASRAAA